MILSFSYCGKIDFRGLKISEFSGRASLVPRPHPQKEEEGLAHFEPFLVFADSTVQDPGLPIRLQACDIDQLAIAIINRALAFAIDHWARQTLAIKTSSLC